MSTTGLTNTLAVTRKELKTFADGATLYIVVIVFLLLWEFIFFKDVFLQGDASLRGLFGFLPWMFLLLVPALTMGSIAQEQAEGTLEFLLTHPLRDRDLVFGKFLAPLSIIAATLLFIVPIGIGLDRHSDLDWGIVFGQYLSALFMAGALVSLGVLVSSVFKSQISSLLVTAAASFAFIIIGLEFVTAQIPLGLAPLFEQLSIMAHFQSMSRGVIDLRDLWYFASFITVCLSLAYLQLLRRRYGNRTELYRPYQIGVLLLVGIALLTNVVGSRIPGRVDLTENRLYTLTDATRDTINDVDDVVNITLYASKLPSKYQPTLRDVKDMLRDYETLGKGDIVVKIKDPTKKKIAEEAQGKGVQQMQFNTVEEEEYKVKNGFLGMVISTGGKNEAIPFVQDTRDLEYQLTSLIRQLTVDKKQKVAFLSGFGAKDQQQGYGAFNEELGKQFDVTSITADDAKKAIPKDTAVLVVGAPTEKIDAAVTKSIQKYLDGGGSALLLAEGMKVDQQSQGATDDVSGLPGLASKYGVTVQKDMVFDGQRATIANLGGYQVPYALWPQVLATGKHPAVKGLEGASLIWASSIDIDDAALDEQGLQATKLLKTSEAGGSLTGQVSLNPQQQVEPKDLGERVTAVAVSAKKGAKKDGASKPTPRLIVVGDGDFLSDDFLQSLPENMVFGQQSLAWLGQESSLASITARKKVERKLNFEEESDQSKVKWANMLLALLLPAGLGVGRMLRRRRLMRNTYDTRKPYAKATKGKVPAK